MQLSRSLKRRHTFARFALASMAVGEIPCFATTSHAEQSAHAGVAVGAQYDTAHVYTAPADFDRFVDSFVATFGGTASDAIVANVLPVPSQTRFRTVRTPAGALSAFAFTTPVPYPFGQERTGYLVSDMDQALRDARAAGAEVLVDTFKDAIGCDAVIQWPGGVKMQLYWHFKAPSSAPLATIPDNRVYVSPDAAERFVSGFVRFSHGRIVSDEKSADAGEIGRPRQTYRRIRIESPFGKMQVHVSDGHLPYPFGVETTGYEVAELAATLAKAKAAGATLLSAPFTSNDRISAVLEFPGGYVAEVHSAAGR
ncbi:MAG: glyoxalase [Dokdonella sp.]